ncbi:uncharacterized protein LOC124705715 [Lolium rigidum]|uniref:uncharacterized protein LOC124705715 n=1 Tax=Lolium rigidum TaxID=89674 RepID=UPI001F5CE224|nr:uncharacterized protein LOC124705715 [Lolium rigidum]
MIIFLPRSILLQTICHRRNSSTSQMALGMHRWPLYMAVTTTSHCGHHQNNNRHLAVHLDLMRHLRHASTVSMETATMGIIHNNFLPLTHLPMAHSQAMATSNSSGNSLPLLWRSLLVHLGNIHLLRCSVSQHLMR